MSGAEQQRPAGMQRIPFPLESYQHASPPLSSKRLLNLFAEQAPSDARTAAALIPTPGLQYYTTIGQGPIKAMNYDLPGLVYIASGTRFYRMAQLPTGAIVIDDLGEIGTPDAPLVEETSQLVSIAVGPSACVVCVPPNAFTCANVVGQPLNQLGGTFPGNATSVAYLDGYFVFTSQLELQQFFISKILDPSDYDALDFASADAIPNSINFVVSNGGELWFIGKAGIETWYDSGEADFPFRRRSGAIIEFGNATPRSVAKGDHSVFWVGLTDMVFRTEGYRGKRISTHAIERIIATEGTFTVQSAFCYMQRGHTFYVINFPARTLVYDCATGLWHDRSSGADGSGRWRANAVSYIAEIPLLGDAVTGNVWLAVHGFPSDGGVPIRHELITPPLYGGSRRAFCSRVEVEMEVGTPTTPGSVLLDWSDDGGFTWTAAPRSMSGGLIGETRHRVYTTRLGSFRQRVFRIVANGRAPTFYAIDADITGGAS